MFKKLKIVKEFLSVKNFKTEDELKSYQQKMLRQRLSTHNSSFYPKSNNLNDFPIINKKIFMENFEAINTVNISKEEAYKIALQAEESRDFSSEINGISIGLSSGTSGNRGIFLVSEDESAKWAGYILRKMLPRPYLQRHKIAFFLRANNNLYESINSILIKFKFFDLIKPIEEHIEELNRMQPTLLIAPAQVLKLLALSNTLKINPKKIISVAEVLEDDDKDIIENRFKQKVAQVYQCTEGFLAHTCSEGNLHLNEDIVYIEKEWIDKDSGRFSPIITDFFRSSQAIIRYKLDDILIYEPKQCPCGSVYTRIKKIEGRCDDILKVKDNQEREYLIYPDFIRRAIISASDDIKEYSVEHKDDGLHIYLEPIELQDRVDISLKKLYKKLNVKELNHTFHHFESLPLTQKRRRVKQL